MHMLIYCVFLFVSTVLFAGRAINYIDYAEKTPKV